MPAYVDQPCGTCKSKGYSVDDWEGIKTPCKICGGTGTLKVPSDWVQCKVCNGRGKFDKSGWGDWVDCKTCEQKGWLKPAFVGGESRGNEVNQRTPPLTSSETAKLVVLAGSKCENPNCKTTHPLDVHHIKPRNEGGTNRQNNLIVLCANCHRIAQPGGYSRATLKEWVAKNRTRAD